MGSENDHPGICVAIRRLLVSHDCDVVGSVEDGARVLEEAVRLQPDVILLDLNMPHMNGIDACRALTRMLPRTRTIVVTAEDPVVVRHAAGAFAFVEKHALHTALLPAIRSRAGFPQHRMTQAVRAEISAPVRDFPAGAASRSDTVAVVTEVCRDSGLGARGSGLGARKRSECLRMLFRVPNPESRAPTLDQISRFFTSSALARIALPAGRDRALASVETTTRGDCLCHPAPAARLDSPPRCREGIRLGGSVAADAIHLSGSGSALARVGAALRRDRDGAVRVATRLVADRGWRHRRLDAGHRPVVGRREDWRRRERHRRDRPGLRMS